MARSSDDDTSRGVSNETTTFAASDRAVAGIAGPPKTDLTQSANGGTATIASPNAVPAKIESELRIDERTRLAAELHDNTVQNLTAIAYRITAYSVNQQLDAIRKKLGAANRTEAVAIALRKYLLKI